MSPRILWPLLSGTQLPVLISHFVHQNFILAPPLFMSTCHICPTLQVPHVVCQHFMGPTLYVNMSLQVPHVVCQYVIIGPMLYVNMLLQVPNVVCQHVFISPTCCSPHIVKVCQDFILAPPHPHVVVNMSLQVPMLYVNLSYFRSPCHYRSPKLYVNILFQDPKLFVNMLSQVSHVVCQQP